MSTLDDRSQALRVIEGLESGALSSSDVYNVIKDKDAVLVYFILRYLKEKFPASHQDAKAVQERLIELTSTYDDVRKKLKEGEKDAMREWFDDSHSVREFVRSPEQFVDLIIDKLEG